MSREIRVFHNNFFRDGSVFGYQPEPYRVGDVKMPAHTVTEVYRYSSSEFSDVEVLEAAFHLFNVGDDPAFVDRPDPRAVEYRDRGNRSLSKSDVVAIGDTHNARWYACASGWDRLDHPPVIDNQEDYGTTPADAPLVQYTVRFDVPDEMRDEPWLINAVSRNQLLRRVVEQFANRIGIDWTRLIIRKSLDANVWHVNQIHPVSGWSAYSRNETTIAVFTTQPEEDPVADEQGQR